MFPGFFTGASKRREIYLDKEKELIELSLRSFGTQEESSWSPPSITTFDTLIPATTTSSDPEKGHGYCLIDGKCSTYKIHGIRVKSEQGDGVQKETTPIVLLHGYGNSAAFFYRTWPELSKYCTTIYALDWLGFGASSRPRFWPRHRTDAENFFVDALEAWRAALQIESFILVGHSLGGYLSVAYGERFPERLQSRSLFLMSPVGVPHESKDVLARREKRRTSSWTSRFTYCFMELVSPHLTFGVVLRSTPKFLANSWLIPYYASRFERTIPDPAERLLIAEAGFYTARMPSSGERCLHRILNPYAYARQPLVDRLTQMLASHGQLQSCFFYYGDRDWMDPAGGLAIHEARHDPTSAAVEVYRVRDSGHMISLENPVEFVHGVVRHLLPTLRLPADAPFPQALCRG